MPTVSPLSGTTAVCSSLLGLIVVKVVLLVVGAPSALAAEAVTV
jgi:hypothetical protein